MMIEVGDVKKLGPKDGRRDMAYRFTIGSTLAVE